MRPTQSAGGCHELLHAFDFFRELESDPDGPDISDSKWGFLAD